MKKISYIIIAIFLCVGSFAQGYEGWVVNSDNNGAVKGNYGFSNDLILMTDSQPLLLFPSKDTYFTMEDTTTSNTKRYKIWLTLNNEPLKSKGILYQSKESSILIAPFVNNRQLLSEKYLVEFQIKNIETIKLRKNKKIGNGILIGAITGLAVGGLIGLISGDDPPEQWFAYTAGEKAIIIGTTFAIGGAGIGAALGSIKIKVPINGNYAVYKKNTNKLRKYSFKK